MVKASLGAATRRPSDVLNPDSAAKLRNLDFNSFL